MRLGRLICNLDKRIINVTAIYEYGLWDLFVLVFQISEFDSPNFSRSGVYLAGEIVFARFSVIASLSSRCYAVHASVSRWLLAFITSVPRWFLML